MSTSDYMLFGHCVDCGKETDLVPQFGGICNSCLGLLLCEMDEAENEWRRNAKRVSQETKIQEA